MKLTENDIECVSLADENLAMKTVIIQYFGKPEEGEQLKQQILKNQENIEPDKALEYVLENYYDEVKEAVFEQEADNQRE